MPSFIIEMDIEGPVITTGLETPAYGVDTAFLLDHRGRPILPGTLIKGIVRDALSRMNQAMLKAGATALPLEKWFGGKKDDARDDGATHFDPDRGCVRFGDFHLVNPARPYSMTRIQVEETTGSVKHGMLQLLETPVPPGDIGCFSGRVFVYDSAHASQARDWIEKALRLIPALGGAKSAGFGFKADSDRESAQAKANIRLGTLENQIPIPQSPLKTSAKSLTDKDVVAYALIFDEPFLVGSEAISGNLFKGSTIIPGAAVKGALAEALGWRGKLAGLADALDKTIFRHAKPLRSQNGKVGGRRMRAIPWSLYSVETFDRAGKSKLIGLFDALVDTPDRADGVVTFPHDWKNDADVGERSRKLYNQDFDPVYDIRTRTAIETKGVAATSQLFTRMALCPEDYLWAGELVRGNVPITEFNEIVAALAEGLPAIGKTRVPAAVAIFETGARIAEPYQKPGLSADQKTWRIVLETDALMHGPGDILSHRGKQDPLAFQYQDYFANTLILTPDDLTVEYFARQKWAGGYQARRFKNYTDKYYPHLLTEAGSVFLLTVPDTATKAISGWVTSGLPLPKSVPKAITHEYLRSPFNPENGYGEVSIEARKLNSQAV